MIASTLFLMFVMLPVHQEPVGAYEPDWAGIKPRRVIRHADTGNDSLVKAVEALQPGDQLFIATGTYNIRRRFDVRVSGTEGAPIRIEAEPGAKVVITRPDAGQNVVEIGQGGPVHHLCLRGVEITGGSHGLRIGRCTDVWIDRCHIHHTGAVCLSANSANTRRLFLTRNHNHHGGGHGEGMYLGANHGEFTMSESVIALNHIHDCQGEQGDGIEVKQGSWGNLIAGNDIHDTRYPCITVFGTGGKPVNIIERNLCRRSADNAMQVQGEAIVRNNLVIGARGAGFASTDHQGKSLKLSVTHNTIINTGNAFRGVSWNGREGMVLANNVLYSRDKKAIDFPSGGQGVMVAGNIILGGGPREGTFPGKGLGDFMDLSWDGEKHDATPVNTGTIEKADKKYFFETDYSGAKRKSLSSGAFEPRQ